MTVGKRMVGIRVVDEARRRGGPEGVPADFDAMRLVDGFLFYLVGAILALALASPLGQRLGDRAASTVVVRR